MGIHLGSHLVAGHPALRHPWRQTVSSKAPTWAYCIAKAGVAGLTEANDRGKLCWGHLCNSFPGLYVLGLKTSVLPTSIWHSHMPGLVLRYGSDHLLSKVYIPMVCQTQNSPKQSTAVLSECQLVNSSRPYCPSPSTYTRPLVGRMLHWGLYWPRRRSCSTLSHIPDQTVVQYTLSHTRPIDCRLTVRTLRFPLFVFGDSDKHLSLKV
jgi:hypothetical protein